MTKLVVAVDSEPIKRNAKQFQSVQKCLSLASGLASAR